MAVYDFNYKQMFNTSPSAIYICQDAFSGRWILEMR